MGKPEGIESGSFAPVSSEFNHATFSDDPDMTPTQEFNLEIASSPGLCDWLYQHRINLLISTYQNHTLFCIGPQADGLLSVQQTPLKRCMGISADSQGFYIGGLFQIWRFENILPPGRLYDGHDRVYVPRLTWTTGDVDVHDVAVDKNGRVLFVNTRFSCLATVSATHSFTPLWQPSFISQLQPEDRCHLNGLAMRDGQAAYLTALGCSDTAGGWREHRLQGGILLDVLRNEVVLEGLSMPHSPRWYRGRLWLLESGTGQLGWFDAEANRFVPFCFCPGYLRGLTFQGDYAVIASSNFRESTTFGRLPVQSRLEQEGLSAQCGIFVVNLTRAVIEYTLTFKGDLQELFDVAVLQDTYKARAIDPQSEEMHYLIHVDGIKDGIS